MPLRMQSHRPTRYHDARRDKRMAWPVFEVRIGDEVWVTENWSLGGLFIIRPYQGLLEPEDPVRGTIATPDDPDRGSIPFTATVVRRVRRSRALALQFRQVDERLLAFFERNLRRRLRATGLRRVG